MVRAANERTRFPFRFPKLGSYCMGKVAEMSTQAALNNKQLAITLIKTIYRLLQFHIKRLFTLKTFDFGVPMSHKYNGTEWDENPEQWFSAMLHNILPGAVLTLVDFNEPSMVKDIAVNAFEFANQGPIVTFHPGISGIMSGEEEHVGQRQDTPFITLFSLPKVFWNKQLPPHFTFLTAIRFYEDFGVANGDVLECLLEGVALEFDVTGTGFDVNVTGTDKLPPVEESRKRLNALFNLPLERFTFLPKDINYALEGGQIPKLTCYHREMFPSTDLAYECMLAQILVPELIPELTSQEHASSWQHARTLIQSRARQFLPNCEAVFENTRSKSKALDIGVWDAKTGRFIIYEERLGKSNTRSFSLSLSIGQPQHLSARGMAEIRKKVFPTMYHNIIQVMTDTIFGRIVSALSEKINALQAEMALTKPVKGKDKKHRLMKSNDIFGRSMRDMKLGRQCVLLGDFISQLFPATEDPFSSEPAEMPDELPTVETTFEDLTVLSVSFSARCSDSTRLMSMLKVFMNGAAASVLPFHLSSMQKLHLSPHAQCHPLSTLLPMIPYPPDTIVAYLSDGRVVSTTKPFIPLPRLPSGNHFLWFDVRPSAQTESLRLRSQQQSIDHLNFFFIR